VELSIRENMKYLHTMIRVNNLEESIKFYTEALGMKVISKDDYPDGQFTLVFVGYGQTKSDPCIELTYNYGKDSYTLGDAFGHIALGADDIYGVCEKVKAQGYKVVREPGPMKHGTTVIAFIEDPSGYKIELIQSKT
jgi:lactoylglutathione lyase